MNIIEGKFNLIASSLGGGKTTVLANLVTDYRDKNVIYYALDSSDDYIRKRIYSLLNNKPLNNIRPNVDNKYVGINLPHNILTITQTQPLDKTTFQFDIETCNGTEIVFIDTINLFDVSVNNNSFEDKLKAKIAYFNSVCKKYNITIVASLNVLRVQTFKVEDWAGLIGGSLLSVDNQFTNFKVYDGVDTTEYTYSTDFMRIGQESNDISELRHNMQPLYIKSTGFAPEINFNIQQNHYTIKGRSYPSNAIEFWEPILDWLDMAKRKVGSINLDINLDYINSSSEKMVLELVKSLSATSTVTWRYDKDDEDVRDMGRTFKSIVSAKFNLVSNASDYIDSDIYD